MRAASNSAAVVCNNGDRVAVYIIYFKPCKTGSYYLGDKADRLGCADDNAVSTRLSYDLTCGIADRAGTVNRADNLSVRRISIVTVEGAAAGGWNKADDDTVAAASNTDCINIADNGTACCLNKAAGVNLPNGFTLRVQNGLVLIRTYNLSAGKAEYLPCRIAKNSVFVNRTLNLATVCRRNFAGRGE